MHGSLNEDSLPTVFRRLYADSKSGILHLSRSGLSKRIYFREGAISFAGSDIEEERLGESLIRVGNIKRADLEEALQVVKQTGQGLGKILVEMGLALPEEITAVATKRMKAIVYSLLAWDSGEYLFEELEHSVDEDMAIDLSLAELILEGTRRIQDPAMLQRLWRDPKASLHWPATASLPYEESSLTAQESMVLDIARTRVDGVSTADDIAAASPLSHEETLRCLYGLVSVGVLEAEQTGPALLPSDPASSTHTLTQGTEPLADLLPPSHENSLSGSFPAKLGRYEIQETLGRGGMGAVYLGQDPTIDRTVAIKLIQTAGQLTPAKLEKYRERFYREAKAAGKLMHPGIVTVFDVGHTSQETPFIVMEYVPGQTLQKLLETKSVGVAEAVRIARDLLDALAYAHSQKVIHRDIKTANILMTDDGHPKIMDFGIAHVVDAGFTEPEEIVGSLDYMAPEQLSKGPIDQRTDLFAFGVVLYLMLTGKLPFAGDSFAAVAQAILSEKPQSPERLNPAVSPALAGIVLRLIAKDPTKRFPGAEEVAKALDSLTLAGRAGASSSPFQTLRTRVQYLIGAAAMVGLLGAFLSLFFFFLEGKALVQTKPQAGRPPLQRVERTSVPVSVERKPVSKEEPSEEVLFDEARAALSLGDLDASRVKLEALLQRNPGYAGVSELLVELDDERWERANLPMTFDATHDHSIGECAGTLSLENWGIRYDSDKHEWRWHLDQIRLLEREDESRLQVETHDKDIPVLGRPKSYKFSLGTTLDDDAWNRYQRLAQ